MDQNTVEIIKVIVDIFDNQYSNRIKALEDRIAILESKLIEQDMSKVPSKSLVPMSAPVLKKMPSNPMDLMSAPVLKKMPSNPIDLIAQMMKDTMMPTGAGMGGLPGNVGMQITIQQMDQPSNVINLEDEFLSMMMQPPRKE